ncbi:hypothetical protein C6P61_16050 [Malikia spinosa]|uniref:NERD domain-containing protein n=1 Tax=Malikia spinosa TaxID=86180 RepID=A0A2S9KAT2_9BURK|nr:hypothetical protein [Malikia spinosa]PRD67495.1 hypothetical protein C6P61_16050 [Malikia spinosa]
MSVEIAALLAADGPMTSGVLATALAANLSITPAAARKRIERRALPVRAVKLVLHRGAQFLYLESQYGSPKFWDRLAEALMEGNGAYARAIRALTARGGIIPTSHFAAAAGTSSGQRQIPGDEVVKRLVDAELLQIVEMPGLGPCVAFARGEPYLDDRFPEVRARLIAERVLLQSIQEWAAKLGFGSFHSFKLRASETDSAPAVGQFIWDLSAPSFLGPLANWSDPGKPKPGFLVVDVLLTEVVGVADISPFLYKCTSLRQLRSVGRCMQFFVANRYSQEALNQIRRAGIVPATPEALFGTEVAKALLTLLQTLSEAADKAIDPLLFSELFERLGKAEGAVGTLRGALFEYVVADVVRQTEPPADITMNRIYREGGKDVAEVDVLLILKNRYARFIECKGILPGNLLSDEEVEKWLNKRIPVVLAQTRKDNVLSKLEHWFELWVTGELTAEAKGMIAAAQARAALRGYSIRVFYAADIDHQVSLVGDPSLRKVVYQHFLHAPMAFPDADINPLSKRSIPQSPFDFADVSTEAAVTSPAKTRPALPTR